MSTLFTASAATVPPSSANKRGGFSNTLSNLGVNYGKRHSQAAQLEVRHLNSVNQQKYCQIKHNILNTLRSTI